MKNVIKFLLKMIVAATIVVCAVVLVVHFTTPHGNATAIADMSYETKFAQKYENSYDGLANYSTSANKKKVINITNKINSFLLEYYNHYLTQSGFENEISASKRNQVTKKTEDLLSQVSKTTEFLGLTKAGSVPKVEIDKRFEKTVGFYLEQTKMLFELDDIIKEYVEAANYQSDSMRTTYEVQLQMVKDYAKCVFDKEIYGHFDDPVGDNISSTRSDSFESVLDKFNARQKVESNSREEVRFFLTYPTIEKKYLNDFYSNVDGKMAYANAIENETIRDAMKYLNNYINQSSF